MATEEIRNLNTQMESLRQQNEELTRKLDELRDEVKRALGYIDILVSLSQPPIPGTPTPGPQEIQRAVDGLLVSSERISKYDPKLAQGLIRTALQFRPFDLQLQQQLHELERLQP